MQHLVHEAQAQLQPNPPLRDEPVRMSPCAIECAQEMIRIMKGKECWIEEAHYLETGTRLAPATLPFQCSCPPCSGKTAFVPAGDFADTVQLVLQATKELEDFNCTIQEVAGWLVCSNASKMRDLYNKVQSAITGGKKFATRGLGVSKQTREEFVTYLDVAVESGLLEHDRHKPQLIFVSKRGLECLEGTQPVLVLGSTIPVLENLKRAAPPRQVLAQDIGNEFHTQRLDTQLQFTLNKTEHTVTNIAPNAHGATYPLWSIAGGRIVTGNVTQQPMLIQRPSEAVVGMGKTKLVTQEYGERLLNCIKAKHKTLFSSPLPEWETFVGTCSGFKHCPHKDENGTACGFIDSNDRKRNCDHHSDTEIAEAPCNARLLEFINRKTKEFVVLMLDEHKHAPFLPNLVPPAIRNGILSLVRAVPSLVIKYKKNHINKKTQTREQNETKRNKT